MAKSRNKSDRKKSGKTRAAVLPSPSTVGFIVLFLVAGGIWGTVFLSRNNWVVNAPPEDVRAANLPLPAKSPKTAESIELSSSNRLFYQYTERLEEQSAIILSLALALVHENLKFNRVPKDLSTLIKITKSRELWQPAWELSPNFEKVQTRNSIHYLRYRPAPPAIEVLTVSRHGDIQVTLMRLPETDGAPVKSGADDLPQGQAGAVILVSPRADAPVPPPFSATALYEKSGWRREPLKLSLGNEIRSAEIRGWIERTSKNLARKESR